MKLRQHIDRAGAVKVVSDGARAANRNLPACVVPASEGSCLAGRAVIVKQPHGLLIAPHRHCCVVLLSLYPLAASERTNVCWRDGRHSFAIAADRAAEADSSLRQRMQEGRGSEPIVGEEDVLLMLIGCGHAKHCVDRSSCVARSILFPRIHLEVQLIVVARQAPSCSPTCEVSKGCTV